MVVGLVILGLLQSSDSVLARAKRVAATVSDTGAAREQGFGPLAVGRIEDLTPFQGQHWLHPWRVSGGSPDLATLSFLMFVPINGGWRLAGLAYSRRIELALREAVVKNQFDIFYQPIINVRERRLAIGWLRARPSCCRWATSMSSTRCPVSCATSPIRTSASSTIY